jgi:hypothetical protein
MNMEVQPVDRGKHKYEVRFGMQEGRSDCSIEMNAIGLHFGLHQNKKIPDHLFFLFYKHSHMGESIIHNVKPGGSSVSLLSRE